MDRPDENLPYWNQSVGSDVYPSKSVIDTDISTRQNVHATTLTHTFSC